jgi:hypothetical protein
MFRHRNGYHQRKPVRSQQRELPGISKVYSYIHTYVKSGVYKFSINLLKPSGNFTYHQV